MLCVNFICCTLNRREYEGKCYKNEGKERMSTRAVHLWLVEFARLMGWRDIHSPSELPEIHRTRDGSINSRRQGHTRCKHMSVSEASLSHFTSLVGVWKEKNKRWPPMLICGISTTLWPPTSIKHYWYRTSVHVTDITLLNWKHFIFTTYILSNFFLFRISNNDF